MNIFSNKFINLITLIISIIIFLFINFTINNFQKANTNEISKEENIEEDFNKNENNQLNNSEKEEQQNSNWFIEIKSISLKAPIEETTEMEILNNYVGHFEDTSLTLGNIGLAGHNMGYDNNYFEDLKDVKKGDEIRYKYNDFEMTYIVDVIEIIKNTDWSYLENTDENKITLITCVEGEPNYRRCVQATEK